jgi:uncharacterized C2H2 Zn-finger protein
MLDHSPYHTGNMYVKMGKVFAGSKPAPPPPKEQQAKMFSLMTALLSPKVMETLESRKEELVQTLTERAGVLCVQPSSGICMLQGEWECMKKAHVVLEEFCLQVESQNTVQALLKARQDAYNSMQANYHKMAEEAIKGFNTNRDSPNECQTGEPGVDVPHDAQNGTDGPGYYKPDPTRIIAEIHQRAAAQQRAGVVDVRAALEGADGRPDSPEPHDDDDEMEEKMHDDDGHKSESDHTKAVTPSDLASSVATPGGGSVDHDEDDRDSEGGLRIALSEEENGSGHSHSQEEGSEAQNLSVRRTSQDTDASGHSPYSNSYGSGQGPPNGGGEAPRPPPPRMVDPYSNSSQPPPPELNPEMKPDMNQLRAMAQFYAMQQSVFNYGYLSVEARKMLESRMAAGASPHDLVSVGLQYPGQQPPPGSHDGSGLSSPLNSPTGGYHPMAPTDLSLSRRGIHDIGDQNRPPPNGKEGGPDGGMHKYRSDTEDEENDAAGAGGGGNYIGRTDWPAALKGYPSFPGMIQGMTNPVTGLPNPASIMPTGGGNKPYECPACLATFPSRDAVQEHMLQAHAVGPGLQEDAQNELVRQQQQTHLQPGPGQPSPMNDAYTCPVCGKFYKSGQRLREHILLHDKNYQRPQYPCPACGKTFTYRHNMKVHFQKIHKGKQPIKRHECGICGQKFHKPVYLRHHLLRHKETLYGSGAPFVNHASQPSQVAVSARSPMEQAENPLRNTLITNQSPSTSS